MDAVGGTTREAAIDKESDSEVDAERTMSVPRSRAIASLFEGDAGRVRALIARFKGQRLRLESEIRGWSMSGSLPAGSRIQIRCESLAGLGVGDVVVQGLKGEACTLCLGEDAIKSVVEAERAFKVAN